MLIKSVSVLNTITALGADLSINSDGTITVTNFAGAIPTSAVKDVTLISPVTAVAGVVTVTPTAANSTLYKVTINGYNTTYGYPQTVVLTYTTAASGDDATSICNAFRTQLAAQSSFSVVGTGTATLVLTGATTVAAGTTPYVSFSVAGSLGSVAAASSSGSAVTIYPNISATRTTQSVVGVGSAAILASKYPASSNTNLNYAQVSDLVSGSTYVECDINYTTDDSGIAYSNGQNLSELVILMKSDASNIATLASSWGTLAQLALGYKATIVAVGANVDFGSSSANRASGSWLTELLKSGDMIAISDGVTTATNGTATVLLPFAASTTAAALTATNALIDNTNTVGAAAAFVIHKANLPL